MSGDSERPTCSNCGKPAYMGGDNYHLCLDCYALAEHVRIARHNMFVGLRNDANRRMNEVVGLPPELHAVPLVQLPVLRGAPVQTFNIAGNVNVLNTGVIETLNTTVGSLASGGQAELADLLNQLRAAIERAEELSIDDKNKALDLLSSAAEEAAAPQEKRRGSTAKLVWGALGDTVRTAAAAWQLWDRASPLLP